MMIVIGLILWSLLCVGIGYYYAWLYLSLKEDQASQIAGAKKESFNDLDDFG